MPDNVFADEIEAARQTPALVIIARVIAQYELFDYDTLPLHGTDPTLFRDQASFLTIALAIASAVKGNI